MRVPFVVFLIFAHVFGQAIVPNAWICDFLGVEGAKSDVKQKYRALISALNKDKTLKAQQNRVATWIKTNSDGLPALKERADMVKNNKVMIPNLMAPAAGSVGVQSLGSADMYDSNKDAMAISASYKQPETVDQQIIDNAVFNAKYWLAMRARDLNMINDIFDRIGTELSTDKIDEIKNLLWSEDKRYLNFYRPHYDTIKQLILATITSNTRRTTIKTLMEEAEALDDESEPDNALMPLMEPMAAEFFVGCGL